MELNTVQNIDCIEGLKQLPDGSVDLAFCDPPFNLNFQYDQYNDNRADDDYLDWCIQWLAEVYRVLKPNGVFWLAIGEKYSAELKILSKQTGFICRDTVIWFFTFGMWQAKHFSKSHSYLFHFVKDENNFTFNVDAIRVPSARQTIYNDARAHSKGKIPDNVWILRPQDLQFGCDNDVWYHSRICGTFAERTNFHPCQMPLAILERIIKVSSNAGDLVVDPMCGSGTSLVAAKQLGRNYLGFEISAAYCKGGRERLNNDR